MPETAWKQKSLCQKIIDRQGQYAKIREPYDDRFADIVDFCDPGLTAWKGEDTEGQFRGEKLFEGTPPWALRVMADGWLGNLISETLRWLKYLFGDNVLRGNDEVNSWLQDLEDHMYFTYRQSELYGALAPYTRAALSVGSPVILPYEDEETRKIIKCEVPHPRENYHGPYDGYHRKYQITALEAFNKFMGGEMPENIEDAKLSRAILDNLINGRHAEKHWFIRGIYRQDDLILSDAKTMFKNKPWMEFYVECNTDDIHQVKDPILVQGYWTKPHIRWDYEKNPDEFYARTPSWNAMMDIRSGQQLARGKMEAGDRSLNPPMWAQRQFKGRINLKPKGFTYYDQPDEAVLIPKPIQEQINYAVGKEESEEKKAAVERHYHVDLWRMLSRLSEGQKSSWPTATHVIHLNAEKATILAPRVGRFTPVLREIDTRFMDIEDRAGRLPEPPDIVKEYMAYRKIVYGDTKLRLDIEFIGPLGQMQQKGLALGRVEAGIAIVREFMQIDQDVVHKIRPTVALEKALEQVGFSQDAIVSEDEYQEGRAARAEAAAQDEMQDKAIELAKAVPPSKTIEPGSPLNAMQEAAQG